MTQDKKAQSSKLSREPKTRAWAYIAIGIISLIVVVAICQSLLSPGRHPSQAAQIEYVTHQGSLERRIEEIMIRVMGVKTNWDGGPRRLILIDKAMQVTGPDSGGFSVIIQYRADDNHSPSLTKFGIIQEARDFFKSLYTSPYCIQIKRCTLQPFAVLVDKFGNKSESQVGALRLRRTISQKINWENMYTDRFEKILEEDPVFWLHSEFY